MPEVIGAFAPRRPERPPVEMSCLRETRAEALTLGGIVVFVVCVILTVAAFGASQFVEVARLQQAILVMLTVVSWFYFLDSITERLCLNQGSVEFTALFSRRRSIPLKDLDAMLLVHQGYNLDKGVESLEFRRHDGPPERVSLGPCWQRQNLEAFLRAVEEALQDPELFDDAR